MRSVFFTAGSVLVAACALVGCGVVVPEIKEIWDGPEGTRQIEFEIKKRVYCDIKRAVIYVNKSYQYAIEDPKTGRIKYLLPIPRDWIANVSLSLQVDESGALVPSVTLNKVLPNAITPFPNGNVTTPQSFGLTFGGTLSSTATRIDKFNPSYTIDYLMVPESKQSVCIYENDPFLQNGEIPASSSPLIVSDLGIPKWLEDAVFTNRLLRSSPGAPGAKSGPPPDTITLEIKFAIVSNANVTPVWKLVRISANTGNSPLFAVGRTRTHDLIITIGPDKPGTRDAFLASQIGQAISGANRSLLQSAP